MLRGEAYWRHCLTLANESVQASPNEGRIRELETEVSDLQARLEQSSLSKKPRRHRRCESVVQRIAELDQALGEKRRLRDQIASNAPAPAPQFADVAGLLQKLPLIAERLPKLPPDERRLFAALQLIATYHHDRKEIDIEITLHERGLDGAQGLSRAPNRRLFEPSAELSAWIRATSRLQRKWF